VHNRVQKLLDEERFHFQHATGWTRRLGQVDAVRGEFRDALQRLLPAALRWFGHPDGSDERRLLEEEITSDGPGALRSRFLDTVAPVLESVGLAAELGLTLRDNEWLYEGELDWSGWDGSRRRAGGEGPDAETIARVRGDKNRAFLMD
nr:phenylacetate-CoA oxygenase subunit PaaI [Gemmatimonadota bacterium]